MTNQELQQKLAKLVKEERKITQEILALIQLALERRVYLELGYPSCFEWLVKGFGYSNAAAYRRIEAARLLKTLPEAREKLESGELNLSVLAKAQSHFRAEEREGRAPTTEEKREVVKQLEGKSQTEAEEVLLESFPRALPREVKKVAAPDTLRLSVNLPAQKLQRVRELLSHKFPKASDGELIAFALEFLLEKTDPLRKPTSAAEARRVKIVKSAEGACEYRDPSSGKRCGSRYQIQIDHIQPKARGGGNAETNLRVLCRQHNLQQAVKIFGEAKMRPYWPKP